MNKILRFSFSALLALVVLMAKADVITFTPAEFAATTSADYSLTKGGVTVSVTASTVNDSQIRVFKGQTITISSTSAAITEAKFTCTVSGDEKYGPGCFGDVTVGSYSFAEKVGTWTGSALSFSMTASTNQVRITELTVTIDGTATPQPDPEPQPTPQVTEVNVEKALQLIESLEDGKTTTEEYIVKGFVVDVPEISTSYGNATFIIADDKTATTGLTVYRAKGHDGDKITDENFVKKGDEVEVKGKLQKYVKGETVTPEIATGGHIISINGASTSNVATVKAAIQQPGTIYNLKGQVVTSAYKGLVVKNGRKYIQR